MKYKVTVIVPLYNVSKYIEKCANSLFNQTIANEIEYLFIDDCGTDDTMIKFNDVLSNYSHLSDNIKIYKHNSNLGLGATRSTGLKYAQGLYTIFVDSDDWCDLNMVEELYSKAIQTNTDLLYCDIILEYSNKTIYSKMKECRNLDEYKKSTLDCSIFSGNVIRLVKTICYRNTDITGIENTKYKEDNWLQIKLLSEITSVAYYNKAYYHYNLSNVNSITSVNLDRHVFDSLDYHYTSLKIFLQSNSIEWVKYRKNFYHGILNGYLSWSQGLNIKDRLKNLDNEVISLRILWTMPTFNFFKKIYYSFSLFGIEFFAKQYVNIFRNK